jgi:hypothetical protein
MNALETYLEELYAIRSSGGAVKETSYYPALSNLLNEVGKTLKPRVRCIINIQNAGAGLPDGGLYAAEQFQKQSKGELREGQLPARGAIEVKSTGEEVKNIAGSEQVMRYVNRYKQVLVTNYRDFVLVGVDHEGKVANRESFSLAPNEKEFWLAASHHSTTAQQQGERFIEYLKRVMLHAAPLALPKDVAWFLASYARDAKLRIEESDLPALAAVRAALEEALGLKFEGEKGEHFFRSTLVQTLFYGVFSAWVLWSKKHPPIEKKAHFNWREAAWTLHVPMIKALYDQVATPTKLEPLGLIEVLDWTEAVLNRVDRKAFFENFEEGHAVQYFYEPFLEAFDPELRKELGVWYTPTEVVQYMVARVDTVLRDELDIADGLADPRVYVLDPCCGTGAYLVEVLKRINDTLKEKGEDALTGNTVKHAAMERVFGFEILPAPFVVSHLQLGLLLQNIGAPLSETGTERAGVYLTNALTGWEPPSDEVKKRLQQLAFSFAELKDEHDAAERVKREAPILVILGNPPYNAFAGVSPEEEKGLVDVYKEGLISEWGIKKFNLDDLYIRFFRLAERRIAEKSGQGVVCFISNFSYLSDASFVVMRKRFLFEFDNLWFDSLNGDSRETGKLTPEGKPDPSIFSTEYNREGIRVGTAIGLMVRKAERASKPKVRYREFWGSNKREDLLASLMHNNGYEEPEISPRPCRLSFRPVEVEPHYKDWPTLIDLAAVEPSNGLMEKRGGALIDINKSKLEERMRQYYDPSIDWETLKTISTFLTTNAARFDAAKARTKLLNEEGFDPTHLRRYALRPFDTRWSYYSSVRPLWNEPRPTLWAQCWEGNSFLLTRFLAAKRPEGTPFYSTTLLCDDHFLSPDAVAIPVRLRPLQKRKRVKKVAENQTQFFDVRQAELETIANLSEKARGYLASLAIEDLDTSVEAAEIIWMHALAIGYSPLYILENEDGVRCDWPRIPLPASKELLLHSVELGRKVAALLDTKRSVAGVTEGKIEKPLDTIGIISRLGGDQLQTEEDEAKGKISELRITAGWGHGGKGGITMPGKGKLIERDYTPEERKAIEEAAKPQGLSTEEIFAHLGERTCDVYLNDLAYWRNIPARVWDYTIGGYQVIKKWLSYREHKLLGRPLTTDEAREVMNIARRIAAILLLEPSLDANYQAIKTTSYSWPPGLTN